MDIYREITALQERATDLERRVLLVQELADALARRLQPPPAGETWLAQANPVPWPPPYVGLRKAKAPVVKRRGGWPKGKPRKVAARLIPTS